MLGSCGCEEARREVADGAAVCGYVDARRVPGGSSGLDGAVSALDGLERALRGWDTQSVPGILHELVQGLRECLAGVADILEHGTVGDRFGARFFDGYIERCRQRRRMLGQFDEATRAAASAGMFGVDLRALLPAEVGAYVVDPAKTRRALVALRDFECALSERRAPSRSTCDDLARAARDLTGVPLLDGATVHTQYAALVAALGGAAPSSSGAASMTPVEKFMSSITLVSEAGLTVPQLAATRARNAAAHATVAAFNNATGSDITVCGPEPRLVAGDVRSTVAVTQFNACRARAAAAYAAHNQDGTAPQSGGDAGGRLGPLVLGAIAGGLVGGPIGAVAGALVAGVAVR